MTKLKRFYTYLEPETTGKKVTEAAKKEELSVSTWIKLACLEKLRRKK